MSMFSAFNINASGLTAQRYRMDVISENVANASTTRTADGTPYRRKVVTFVQKGESNDFSKVLGRVTRGFSGQGVRVGAVGEDNVTPMNMVYDPSHPDADENGYVTYPNVNIITEMTNLIDASRAYEANSTAFNASKSMALQGLELGKQ
ncbi:MAG: flagellar basal body rod protein FlgC [Bacteroidales bacterium]|nr:flagellar basal body rod protein FlgC [Lachnoclostridium sp.]MCM1385053.1 flagellar basal body rod protein FlgC [Lachnoclostridium sp.]MCM1465315.1 flagellar basal body rod protein FlgC [Bacteroidales bacterium]